MIDDEFIRSRVQAISEIAEKADPFIRKRLVKLIEQYERRLKPPRAPANLRGLETKLPPER